MADNAGKIPEASPAFTGESDGRPPIPESVKHDDFLAAIRPLLDLLNLDAGEVYNDLHITGVTKRDDRALLRISFNVVASDATMPSTLRYGEFAEISVHCSVEVI